MEIFDKWGKKIQDTSKDVVKKTKDLTEIAKLNREISEEENKIKQTFEKIGRSYYESINTDGEIGSAKFCDLCRIVKQANLRIEQLNEEISALKGIKICPVCKNEVEAERDFCSKCGYRFKDNDVVNPEPVKKLDVCPNCGAPIEIDWIFCGNCGFDLSK